MDCPDEILTAILVRTNYEDLRRFALTSFRGYNLFRDDYLWLLKGRHNLGLETSNRKTYLERSFERGHIDQGLLQDLGLHPTYEFYHWLDRGELDRARKALRKIRDRGYEPRPVLSNYLMALRGTEGFDLGVEIVSIVQACIGSIYLERDSLHPYEGWELSHGLYLELRNTGYRLLEEPSQRIIRNWELSPSERILGDSTIQTSNRCDPQFNDLYWDGFDRVALNQFISLVTVPEAFIELVQASMNDDLERLNQLLVYQWLDHAQERDWSFDKTWCWVVLAIKGAIRYRSERSLRRLIEYVEPCRHGHYDGVFYVFRDLEPFIGDLVMIKDRTWYLTVTQLLGKNPFFRVIGESIARCDLEALQRHLEPIKTKKRIPGYILDSLGPRRPKGSCGLLTSLEDPFDEGPFKILEYIVKVYREIFPGPMLEILQYLDRMSTRDRRVGWTQTEGLANSDADRPNIYDQLYTKIIRMSRP